jgi:hypothetical protein
MNLCDPDAVRLNGDYGVTDKGTVVAVALLIAWFVGIPCLIVLLRLRCAPPLEAPAPRRPCEVRQRSGRTTGRTAARPRG